MVDQKNIQTDKHTKSWWCTKPLKKGILDKLVHTACLSVGIDIADILTIRASVLDDISPYRLTSLDFMPFLCIR